MIKPPKIELGKVLLPSDHKQAIAAEILERFAQKWEAPSYALSPDERTIVREALKRATQGGFADEVDVDAILRRPWG